MFFKIGILTAFFSILFSGYFAGIVGAALQPDPIQQDSEKIRSWCNSVSKSFSDLKWKLEPCMAINWQIGGQSVLNRPLIYADFGDPRAENTTLIFATVHPDEVTPLYLGMKLVNWVKQRESELIKTRVVIAPLVNPDGFFTHTRTRVNAHGVDINRNFGTKDWKGKTLHGNKRRDPGKEPNSEPETRFQVELINRVRPQKILTIHAPLNVKDWDGPSPLLLSQFPKEYVQECDRLRRKLQAKTTGYFPGSLGNYAGHERGIPTLTLELPSADAGKADHYWNQFSQGIRTMIMHTLPTYALGQSLKDGG